MSKFYTVSNSESTKSLFYKRNSYKKRMYDLQENNLIDFQRGENMYYGRIDRQDRAIFLHSNTPGIFKDIKNSSNINMPMKAVNFVVNNFEKLRLDMLKAAKSGKIPPNDKYLSNLSVYRAFESPLKKYEDYQEIYINKLGQIMRENDYNYINMSQFLPRLMNIFDNTLSSSPITLPGFIKSNLNDIMSTGLAIEIADLKYSNDADKINFISSPGWRYFLHACDSYGFTVDMNCPWRIVADINSAIMIQESQNENNLSGELLFSTIYDQAHTQTLGELHSLLSAIYNAGHKPSFFVDEVCTDGTIVKKEITSVRSNPLRILVDYSMNDLMRIYMIIRFHESGFNASISDINKLIDDVIKAISSKNGKKVYFSIFESIMAKTFDKKGSLSYDFNVDKKTILEQRDIRDMGTQINLSSAFDTVNNSSGGGGGY